MKRKKKYLKRRVHKSNRTSGKVTLPVSWIGKDVYVKIYLDGMQ